MQKVLLLIALLLISSCSALVAGQMREERKELYQYQNDVTSVPHYSGSHKDMAKKS